jgi:hypothetical protein
MFRWLMRLIRWLLSFFRQRRVVDSAAPGLAPGGGYQRPRDPLSGVRHPIARRPSGNSAAAAVEEPDEDDALRLVGASK